MNSYLPYLIPLIVGLVSTVMFWRVISVMSSHDASRETEPIRILYSKFPDTIPLEMLSEDRTIFGRKIELVEEDWDKVYDRLSLSNSDETRNFLIAYSNRRTSMAAASENYANSIRQDRFDLVRYSGFAILFWPHRNLLRSFHEFTDLTPAQKAVSALSQLNGKIVFASGETDHARSLMHLMNEYGISAILDDEGSPDACFSRFLNRKEGTFFIGGAQHRFLAEALGAKVLISQLDYSKLNLAAANCFSYIRKDEGAASEIVAELTLAWREICRRIESETQYSTRFKDRLLIMLRELAAENNLDIELDYDDAFQKLWREWFEIEGIKRPREKSAILTDIFSPDKKQIPGFPLRR